MIKFSLKKIKQMFRHRNILWVSLWGLMILFVATFIYSVRAVISSQEENLAAMSVASTQEISDGIEVDSKDDRRHVFIVGMIEASRDRQVNVDVHQKLADYIADKLGKFGILRGEVAVAKSRAEITKLMRQGKIDLYVGDALSALLVSRLSGSQLLVSSSGVASGEEQSVFFSKKENALVEFDDLKGKMLAFPYSNSSVGYLLPKAFLIQEGYSLVEKSSPDDAVGEEEIGYYFVDGNSRVIESVLIHRSDVGVLSTSVLESYPSSDQFNLLMIPDPIPKHLVAINPNLPGQVKRGVEKAFLDLEIDNLGEDAFVVFDENIFFFALSEGEDDIVGIIDERARLVEIEALK